MTTKVINLKGRLQDLGPGLEHGREDLVYIGRRMTRGGWNLPEHPLRNPFQVDTPKKKHDGTRAEVMEKYREYLHARPDLRDLVPALRGRTLACWCAPELCHGDILAEIADGSGRGARRS
ncbi:DUF4326 domain-containing protein [Streptomyces chiangmaiensis]|uniref:DUF4326 domain-containing protein n=1 Tax=Streptomyces chiangmaiensis TaxID=766497 RepID=A0ABU7FLA1_9ACTN|nr:DUF4326 domain-containing protein [Streptomyces chiangmaiensis]MED7824618.1 DUF4326 domain-containing protein [Streptomyces chiangmaiensis]